MIVKATDLFISEVTEAAGFLMEEVGREVDLKDLDRALEALASLHKAGFCHGDARRQNLLTCLGKLKWCDLQLALDISTMREAATKRKFSDDISTLLESFGVALRDNQLDEVLLKEYVSNVSKENLLALVSKAVISEFVWPPGRARAARWPWNLRPDDVGRWTTRKPIDAAPRVRFKSTRTLPQRATPTTFGTIGRLGLPPTPGCTAGATVIRPRSALSRMERQFPARNYWRRTGATLPAT